MKIEKINSMGFFSGRRPRRCWPPVGCDSQAPLNVPRRRRGGPGERGDNVVGRALLRRPVRSRRRRHQVATKTGGQLDGPRSRLQMLRRDEPRPVYDPAPRVGNMRRLRMIICLENNRGQRQQGEVAGPADLAHFLRSFDHWPVRLYVFGDSDFVPVSRDHGMTCLCVLADPRGLLIVYSSCLHATAVQSRERDLLAWAHIRGAVEFAGRR